MSQIFGHPEPSETPTSGCSYVARIDFDYGPRAFKRGEDFDFRALNLTEMQAQELWVAGRLLVKAKQAPQAPQPERKRKAG